MKQVAHGILIIVIYLLIHLVMWFADKKGKR